MPQQSDRPSGAEDDADRGDSGAVTFVIPARDRVALLVETLRSVNDQTVAPAAVIVCDDGSREDVAGAARDAGAFCLRNEAGGWGAGAARNAGLELVETPFVWFLDSDDLLVPEAVERLGGALEASPSAPFAYGKCLVGAGGADGWQIEGSITSFPEERRDPFVSLYVRNWVPASCAVARTSEVRAIGGFPARMVYSEDHVLWLDLVSRGNPAHLDELVGIHRIGGRHASDLALQDEISISARSEDDPRLAPARAARDGVLLWGCVSDALHGWRPDRAARFAWRLLVRRPGRWTILRSLPGLIVRRRASRRLGDRRWADDATLRAWLGSFR